MIVEVGIADRRQPDVVPLVQDSAKLRAGFVDAARERGIDATR